MGTQEVSTTVGAHLVGGVFAPDAETAMRLVAGKLGRHVRALTDGETGNRSEWIQYQLVRLRTVDGIRLEGFSHNPSESEAYAEIALPELHIDPSVTSLPDGTVGYADAARPSYALFQRLRDEGVIPPDVKFQVSVPTAYATIVGFTRAADQERFFPVYADAIARDVEAIAALVGDDLLLQYDVCVELGTLTGNLAAAGNLGDDAFVLDSLRDLVGRTPAGVEKGIHLCYGDYQHQHFAVPQDLSVCVRVANALDGLLDFVHMPVDRDTGRDPAYSAPLRDLRIDARLALGVIDYDGDEQRTAELIAAAQAGSGGRPFAVATECGMARIDQRENGPSIERLLDLHAQHAAPIR